MRGITVTLYEKVKIGEDELDRPIYDEIPVQVDNVLVAPVTAEDRPSDLDLNGARAEYQLGIPKGDSHKWFDNRVSFFGEDWHVIAPPTKGIDELIPLDWNAKVLVERYE